MVAQHAAVVGVEHRATTARDHQRFGRRAHVGHHRPFERTEGGFTARGEDLGDGATGHRFDAGVGIEEAIAQLLREVLAGLGRLDEITATQLPVDGRRSQRSLDEERKRWRPSPDGGASRDAMLDKYGWESVSPGLFLQPAHFLHSVARADGVDQHFTSLWLDFIYGGMYTRDILDNRTRVLCIIGELFVMGDVPQSENHLRSALMHGASPREILEVYLQSTIYVGMPRFVRFVAALERIVEEAGRLAELKEGQLPLPD